MRPLSAAARATIAFAAAALTCVPASGEELECPDQSDERARHLIEYEISERTEELLPFDSEVLRAWRFYERYIKRLNAVTLVVDTPDEDNDAFGSCVSFAEGPTAGTVFIGKEYLERHLEDPRASGVTTAVLFHELAHLAQYSLIGFEGVTQFKLSAGIKGVELQADYLSGWALGKAKVVRVVEPDIESVAEYFSHAGDENHAHKTTHGTPEERREAFLAGYELAMGSRGRFSQVFFDSLNYYD